MYEIIFTLAYVLVPISGILLLAELYWRVSWWLGMRAYRKLQWKRMQESIDVEND